MPQALSETVVRHLMDAVNQGERPADVAKKLKISKATVYKHIRNQRSDEPAVDSNEVQALKAENQKLRQLLGQTLVDDKLKSLSNGQRPSSSLMDTHH